MYADSVVGCGQGSTAKVGGGGTCAYRTKDMGDVSSWRGWDGKSWAATVVDPYSDPPPTTAGHLLAPVGGGRAASGGVTYLESAQLFVAMDSQAVGGGHMQVWYMVSRNMTVWSPRRSAGSVPLPPDGEYIGAKNASFEPFSCSKRSFCQDRLGTNTGKTQKKRFAFRRCDNLPAPHGCAVALSEF